MNVKTVLNRRKKAVSKMPKQLEESIRGSLVVMNRFCGKPNCRCLKGQKHRAIYLSQSFNGKTRMIYIPQQAAKKAAEYIQNYQKAKRILNIISDINIKLITGR